MSALDGIVLDLDDTLLDTTTLLVPAADRRAAAALRSAGAREDDDAIVARFHACRAAGSPTAIQDVGAALGVDPAGCERALRAFLEFADSVPPLALTPAVAAAFDELAALAPLALLTQGHRPTQQAKIDRLAIASRFECVVIVDGLVADAKVGALERLLHERGWRAEQVVVCGDRPTSDIRAANRNGCRGVLVRREGSERAGERANSPSDEPWRTLVCVEELPALLQREGLAGVSRPTE